MTNTKSKFSCAERRNWAWWDGVWDRQSNRRPMWSKSYHCDAKHPFDQTYGKACWQGWNGEPHPNSGEANPYA